LIGIRSFRKLENFQTGAHQGERGKRWPDPALMSKGNQGGGCRGGRVGGLPGEAIRGDFSESKKGGRLTEEKIRVRNREKKVRGGKSYAEKKEKEGPCGSARIVCQKKVHWFLEKEKLNK